MKKNNPHSHRYVFLLLLIIVGSGLLIWAFTFLNGKNLARAPHFDLSAYDQLNWPTPQDILPMDTGKIVTGNSGAVDSEALISTVKTDLSKNAEAPLAPYSIYFSTFFKGKNIAETKANITKFLTAFPSLKNYPLTDIGSAKCYIVELPVATREALKADLLADKAIASLQVATAGAPQYDLCWRTALYPDEAQTFVKNFEGVKFVNPTATAQKYIVLLTYKGSDPGVSSAITKLQTEYSDVIKITE